MVDKDRIKKLLDKVYRLNYWFCNEMLIDEQHAAKFEEACKKANESGEPVIMVSAAEGNAKCMKSCMKDTVAILNFLRKEENWEYLEPWQMAGAEAMFNQCSERWVQDYIDGNDNGYAPDVFVTGIENIRIVLNDVAIRKAITGYSDKLLTLDELNTFLRGRELPPMEAFDAKVTYRDPTNGGKRTTARLLDSKKGVFLMEGDKIGNVQMGPTYENNMEPGIFARTFTMERPLREVVEVVAAGFPKIMYPELIKICTVR